MTEPCGDDLKCGTDGPGTEGVAGAGTAAGVGRQAGLGGRQGPVGHRGRQVQLSACGFHLDSWWPASGFSWAGFRVGFPWAEWGDRPGGFQSKSMEVLEIAPGSQRRDAGGFPCTWGARGAFGLGMARAGVRRGGCRSGPLASTASPPGENIGRGWRIQYGDVIPPGTSSPPTRGRVPVSGSTCRVVTGSPAAFAYRIIPGWRISVLSPSSEFPGSGNFLEARCSWSPLRWCIPSESFLLLGGDQSYVFFSWELFRLYNLRGPLSINDAPRRFYAKLHNFV